MNEPWTIQLFGGLRARQGERQITRFRSQQTGALLAYLAYFRHQSHSREVLIERFWPEMEIEAGRHCLSNALSSLRSQLEPSGVPGGAIIIADRYSVALNPEAVTTDVAAFEESLRRAAVARNTPNYVEQLAAAADAFGGMLLPHYYNAWITPEQMRLSQRFEETVSQLVSLLEKEGQIKRALTYARRVIPLAPLKEDGYREVMRLLADSNQFAEAQRTYWEMERLLEQETGTRPSVLSQQLLRKIEEQETAFARNNTRVTGTMRANEGAIVASVPLGTLENTAIPSPLTGTVTFLLADRPSDVADTLEAVDNDTWSGLLQTEARRYGGHKIGSHDSLVRQFVFANAFDALACAASYHRIPAVASGEIFNPRIALHTGDTEAGDTPYQGPTLRHALLVLACGYIGQTLVSEATAALLRHDLTPAGIRLKDLGLWRIRNRREQGTGRADEEPERIFQADWPGREQGVFPPLQATPGNTSRLPLQFTRFFGRMEEIERINALLASPEVRLLTLNGPGGSGKTRLAIESAAKFGGTFPGDIYFVPLADLADPVLIADAILAATGVPCSPTLEITEQAIAALSRRSTLLLLDNFEHLVDGGAEIVHTLLERVPTLQCLVTSRQLLGLPGEREFAVLPLPVPNGSHPPERLSLFQSVQLFVDRAQAAKPDFRVTSSNAAAIAELCDRLEGLPLAIELAAARALMLTPQQMLAQLSRRFEFLVSRRRGVTERQRTLLAAMDWSYKLLSPDVQRFFCQLSVFRGGWTVDAAEAICEEPLALDVLAQIRECSLIYVDTEGPEVRFRMLETLREYAQEHLTEAELAVVRSRHVAFFATLAETADPELIGPRQNQWVARLDREHDNLRVALDACQTVASNGEMYLRLSAALGRYWEVRGFYAEGRHSLSFALSHPDCGGCTIPRARALNVAGKLALKQSDLAEAQTLFEEAIAINRELGDNQYIAGSLINLGIIAFLQGDYATAFSRYNEGLAAFREIGDKMGIAVTLTNLGIVSMKRADFNAAHAYLDESLAIRRVMGDVRGVSNSLGRMGELSKLRGDYAAAQKLFEESLTIQRELGDRPQIASSLKDLGVIAFELGNVDVARSLFEESLTICRDVGNPEGIAVCLLDLGNISRHQGDYDAACALYEESLTIFRDIGSRTGISAACLNLGYVVLKLGDLDRAGELFKENHRIGEELNRKTDIIFLLESMASLARAQQQTRRSAQLFAAADAFRRTLDVPLSPVEQEGFDANYTALRDLMGEEPFAVAWAVGQSLTREEAVALALENTQSAPAPP